MKWSFTGKWSFKRSGRLHKFDCFSVVFSFQEVNFTVLDTAEAGTNGHGLLNGIEKLLTSVFIPSLRKLDKGWGQLDNKAGQTTKVDFLNSLDAFVAVLSGRKYS